MLDAVQAKTIDMQRLFTVNLLKLIQLCFFFCHKAIKVAYSKYFIMNDSVYINFINEIKTEKSKNTMHILYSTFCRCRIFKKVEFCVEALNRRLLIKVT